MLFIVGSQLCEMRLCRSGYCVCNVSCVRGEFICVCLLQSACVACIFPFVSLFLIDTDSCHHMGTMWVASSETQSLISSMHWLRQSVELNNARSTVCIMCSHLAPIRRVETHPDLIFLSSCFFLVFVLRFFPITNFHFSRLLLMLFFCHPHSFARHHTRECGSFSPQFFFVFGFCFERMKR